MNILYLDKYITVCEKPIGTLSEGEGQAALPTILSKELSARGEDNLTVIPVHRLDKDTTGVIVYARTSAAAAALSSSIANGSFKKQYLAVLCGTPTEESGTLTDLLFYDRKRNKSFVADRKRNGVKSASLDYCLLDTSGDYSLVSVNLHTGRTHQIRVQFASRGLPLAGDRRYGAPKSDAPSIALCAHRLTFPHPKNGALLSFTADVPRTFPWIFFDKALDNHIKR